jgi:hypothetical protein
MGADMGNTEANPFDRESLSEEVLKEWQNLLDDTADILSVPAGLITRVDGETIEVLLASQTEDNPYPAGFTSPYPDSGWFCEYTLKSRKLNLIPNALKDPNWKDNPAAVELHTISYVGVPIERPDGGQFGTVCFLDIKENVHNDLHISLIHNIKRMIELSLRVIFDKEEIDRRDRLLHGLSKIYPICSYCKKIREETGDWVSIEKYVKDVSGADASHGVCPECYKRVAKQLDSMQVE